MEKENGLKETASLYNLSRKQWQSGILALKKFDISMDVFLLHWMYRMKTAGYLDFTTAKKQDCITAGHDLLDPVLKHAEEDVFPFFEVLRKNSDGWADRLLQSGIRHIKRGITGAMYLGCFKTFVFAMQDALDTLAERCLDLSVQNIADAKILLNLYAQSFEVAWFETCENMSLRQQDAEKNETVRLMTLEKCRFENIFNTTSDGVLVMDGQCRVMTANKSLRQYVGENVEGKFVWDVLGLEGECAEDFFRFYPIGQTVEIMPFNDRVVFRLSIVSLAGVSMASHREYLVLLTNITPQVMQRETLEAAIEQHTKDLCVKKQQVEEMNITLHNVLSNIHSDKEKQQETLVEKIRAFLSPSLAQLAQEPAVSVRESNVKLILEQVNAILDGKGFSSDFNNKKMRHLTLTELKVCNFIRTGKTTKEIAQALKISVETVQTHRKNIRKKLGVSGQKAQLFTHLLDTDKEE